MQYSTYQRATIEISWEHRRIVFLFAFVFFSEFALGFYIQPDMGLNAVFRENEGDSLLFFDGDPLVRTSDGSNVDWYKIPDTLHPIATNTSTCYNFEHGDGVYAKTDSTHATCYVFDYKKIKPSIDIIDVTFYCQSTELSISAESNFIPEIAYRTISGMRKVVKRDMKVTYSTLEWKETAWDSLSVEETIGLSYGVHSLSEVLLKEPFLKVEYDDIAKDLYGNYFEVGNINFINMPIAIKSHPTTTTSVRTALNEKERPSEASQVVGSAPLNIFFQSNPTPNVEYVTWTIYKGSSLLVQRNVEDHRYVFTEYGNYRAVCYVSNQLCPCKPEEECQKDSTSFDITISSSMLKVPNVFTPNGDGINDEFRVFYRSIREFHIEVYNRWGKLVYASSDPSKGWDGTINNRPASIGAYFYVIRALGYDADANAKFKSKSAYKKAQKNNASSVLGVYQLSGDINLIR